MLVELMVNSSENNTIQKNLSIVANKNCVLKKAMSIMEIELELNVGSELDFNKINYIHIPKFNSYYFITDVTIFVGYVYRIRCYKDVLQTYASDILNLRVGTDKVQSKSNANMFIDDNSFILENRIVNQIYNFPSGFNNSGEFILITVGG